MLPENANSRASSETLSRASSVTARGASPSASLAETVEGDFPSEASLEESQAAGSQDQAPEFISSRPSSKPSLKVGILVCRIESVSIDFIPFM